jgi:ribosomal protein S18 acetylase RimI-like enzyme
MPTADLLIRAMSPTDLDAVVAVHQHAFKGFFLTRMGPAFLRGYYQTIIDFDGSIALVASPADDPSNIVGFAVGFHDPHRFYALFGQRRRRLLPSMALAALRDPGLIVQILRNVRRVGAQQEQLHPGVVELSSIGVAGPGGGVGGQLVEAFASVAAASGARQIMLTTDRDDNEAVRAFYERRGFTLDGFEDRGERWLCRYVRALGERPSGE